MTTDQAPQPAADPQPDPVEALLAGLLGSQPCRLIPVGAAAQILGVVTKKTLIRWCDPDDPRCPIKRIGRDFFVVAAWLWRVTTYSADWAPPVPDRPAGPALAAAGAAA